MEWYCKACNLIYHTSKWYLDNVLTVKEGDYIVTRCLKGHRMRVQQCLLPTRESYVWDDKMPKLGVEIEKYPEQVTAAGTYRIESVKGPQETRQGGQALILTVRSPDGKQLSLFIPFKLKTSNRTNLSKMVTVFGDDTDRWLGKSVKVTLDAANKRQLEPVK